MKTAFIVLGIIAALALLVLLTAYICFRITFCDSRKGEDHEAIKIPEGSIYQPHKDEMVAWIKRIRALPQEDFSIRSFDGLTLRGKYYEHAPGAPIELMFHGYRGTSERDMCGGVFRCFSIGRSALLVDQRASGRSDGHVITFGVNESRDCLDWVNFMVEHFGPDVKILLSGISMGAATVLTAAGMPLPENVIGVLADCGFTSPKDIICKVMKEDMGLPPKLLYPFVRLGAKLFGHFDPEERSAVNSMRHCRLPVIFYHGDTDAYVPHRMSIENHEACAGPKKLIITPGAGHGLCYINDKETYLNQLLEFCEETGLPAKRDETVVL